MPHSPAMHFEASLSLSIPLARRITAEGQWTCVFRKSDNCIRPRADLQTSVLKVSARFRGLVPQPSRRKNVARLKCTGQTSKLLLASSPGHSSTWANISLSTLTLSTVAKGSEAGVPGLKLNLAGAEKKTQVEERGTENFR